MSSFDDDLFRTDYITALMLENGFSEDIAVRLAAKACRSVHKTHGPGRFYIGKDKPDKGDIRSEYYGGATIASLSRRYDLDYKTIRRIINN